MRGRTLVGSVAGALGLMVLVVMTLVTPQAQGRGASPPQAGPQGGLLALAARVHALEQVVANVLTSYDALAGTPCTTAMNTAGTVHLVGLLKSPVCAAAVSASGRFLDFGLVVLDTQTNLMWEKKTTEVGTGQSDADLHDVDNMYTWCTATGHNTGGCDGTTFSWIGAVNAENFAGFSDWRVPTTDELEAIATCGSGTCIDPIFGPTQEAYYWSSSTESHVAEVLPVRAVRNGAWGSFTSAATP